MLTVAVCSLYKFNSVTKKNLFFIFTDMCYVVYSGAEMMAEGDEIYVDLHDE